jgi:hypothetical protein
MYAYADCITEYETMPLPIGNESTPAILKSISPPKVNLTTKLV